MLNPKPENSPSHLNAALPPLPAQPLVFSQFTTDHLEVMATSGRPVLEEESIKIIAELPDSGQQREVLERLARQGNPAAPKIANEAFQTIPDMQRQQQILTDLINDGKMPLAQTLLSRYLVRPDPYDPFIQSYDSRSLKLAVHLSVSGNPALKGITARAVGSIKVFDRLIECTNALPKSMVSDVLAAVSDPALKQRVLPHV